MVSFRCLVRWGDALLWVRLVFLTASLGSLVLEKGVYLITVQQGLGQVLADQLPKPEVKTSPCSLHKHRSPEGVRMK